MLGRAITVPYFQTDDDTCTAARPHGLSNHCHELHGSWRDSSVTGRQSTHSYMWSIHQGMLVQCSGYAHWIFCLLSKKKIKHCNDMPWIYNGNRHCSEVHIVLVIISMLSLAWEFILYYFWPWLPDNTCCIK